MQQPMQQQHDQMGGQQAISQQMVLCPVRFVYETQILVQPGDHIQPNQTFFINAQNPPPWMQNSLQTRQAITNPAVVYVQHLPNNIVSAVQQPMDQNQLYLQQNFGNFQIQQQMLAQNQDMRSTMQLANIVPNMVQNIQTNVPNDRNNHQNAQMQPNTQIVPVQMNRPVQNQMNQGEIQRQVLMRPQMQQQNCIQRPIMSMNQVQNVQQQTVNVPNQAQNHQIMTNVGRPSPNMNIVRTPIPNNVVSVQPLPKIREANPAEMNKTVNNPLTNVVPNIRNFVPNYYRPIQPRPQNNHNIVNTPKPQHIPVQTVPTTPMYNHDRNNHTSNQQNSNNYAIMQQLNNRKRKSESPDEIQKKMAVKHTPQQIQPSMTITKIVNEIGTNTSPVHKPKINTQYKVNNPVNTNADTIIENIIKDAMMPEKDKLIRNTVYTQARGRVLQDKIEEIKPQIVHKLDTVNIMENRVLEHVKMDIKDESKTIEVNKSITLPNMPSLDSIVIEKKTFSKEEMKPIVSVENNENNNQINKLDNKMDDKTSNETKHVQIVVNYEKSPEMTEISTKDKEMEREGTINKDNSPDNEREERVNDENTEDNKRPIKQENISILTHVLDGYVIQESNFAFPIRKPLKEKTVQANLKTGQNEEKDSLIESMKEELKNNVDIPLLPFHYLMLNNNNNKDVQKEEKAEENKVIEDETKDNPFAKLQLSTVKSWTVNDLCNHLQKYDWKETLSLFQEHEIDGESLLLVSKQQLITIGVKEEHADVICDFVKG